MRTTTNTRAKIDRQAAMSGMYGQAVERYEATTIAALLVLTDREAIERILGTVAHGDYLCDDLGELHRRIADSWRRLGRIDLRAVIDRRGWRHYWGRPAAVAARCVTDYPAARGEVAAQWVAVLADRRRTMERVSAAICAVAGGAPWERLGAMLRA